MLNLMEFSSAVSSFHVSRNGLVDCSNDFCGHSPSTERATKDFHAVHISVFLGKALHLMQLIFHDFGYVTI